MFHNLPGRLLRKADGGTLCEYCDKEIATVVIQGETDSFGYEEIYVCDSCRDKPKEKMEGSCDWCKKVSVLEHTRDEDEGLNGPVYLVCPDCIKAQHQRLQEELDYYKEEEAKSRLQEEAKRRFQDEDYFDDDDE